MDLFLVGRNKYYKEDLDVALVLFRIDSSSVPDFTATQRHTHLTGRSITVDEIHCRHYIRTFFVVLYAVYMKSFQIQMILFTTASRE